MGYILIIFLFLTSCTTYDKLLIYDKTHSFVDTKQLRFNGFYYCNFDLNVIDTCGSKTVVPIFFYSDGTAFTSGHFCNLDSLKSYYKYCKKYPNFDWGSYKLDGNEIIVEFFWPNSGSWTYERYHMNGRIDGDSIFFYSYVDRNSTIKSINYKYYFEPFGAKPDSSLSFIKNNKRFN